MGSHLSKTKSKGMCSIYGLQQSSMLLQLRFHQAIQVHDDQNLLHVSWVILGRTSNLGCVR